MIEYIIVGWRFYEFTGLVLFETAGASGGHSFLFYGFTELVFFGTSGPFGDPLSGLPERGEESNRVVANCASFVSGWGRKAQSLRCSSFPHQTHSVGLWRGPLEAALWKPALIRGNGGETYVPFYEFAQVQLTRFRPVRWRAVGVCLLFAIDKSIASTASTGLMRTAVPWKIVGSTVNWAPQ